MLEVKFMHLQLQNMRRHFLEVNILFGTTTGTWMSQEASNWLVNGL